MPAQGRRQARPYPRSARVNALLHQILAEALEKLVDIDERLGFVTITDVLCEPDLRHALVLVDSLSAEQLQALEEHRKELQSSIALETSLKRVPPLRFEVDPAAEAGRRVEDALRRARSSTVATSQARKDEDAH